MPTPTNVPPLTPHNPSFLTEAVTRTVLIISHLLLYLLLAMSVILIIATELYICYRILRRFLPGPIPAKTTTSTLTRPRRPEDAIAARPSPPAAQANSTSSSSLSHNINVNVSTVPQPPLPPPNSATTTTSSSTPTHRPRPAAAAAAAAAEALWPEARAVLLTYFNVWVIIMAAVFGALSPSEPSEPSEGQGDREGEGEGGGGVRGLALGVIVGSALLVVLVGMEVGVAVLGPWVLAMVRMVREGRGRGGRVREGERGGDEEGEGAVKAALLERGGEGGEKAV